jgi:hypothetical protein
MLVLSFSLVTAVPAAAVLNLGSESRADGNTLESTGANDGTQLLQFTSGGHVLGFGEKGIVVAAANHMLSIDFLNANVVAPESDGAITQENKSTQTSRLGSVSYPDVWDGVKLVYEASGDSIMKSTYYVDVTQEGVSVDQIRLGYNRPVSIDEQGNLVIRYNNGTIVENAPVAWQETAVGRNPVTVNYVLQDENEVGFEIGDFLPGIPLVIDPALTWNTFLGGSGFDFGLAIAVDDVGNVYVAGCSVDTWGGGTDNGGNPVRPFTVSASDAFAAKLDSSGTLIWNTFLGDSGDDYGLAIAVDSNGYVYVGGSSDVTWGTPKRLFTGTNYDAFAAKLDNNGALIWNTFLGSSYFDSGGNVYVGGSSANSWGGGIVNSGNPVRDYTSDSDAFAAKLNSSGVLQWNTFLGGSDRDEGNAIAVDGSGNAYVSGNSYATWQGASSPEQGFTGNIDAFAAKLNGITGALVWNTFLGGSGNDKGKAIAVDGSGVYVVGDSYGWGATPVRAYTPGDYDAFAAKLDLDGKLLWNTFLGGDDEDQGNAIALDSNGNVYVGGFSNATWGAPDRAYTPGISDSFSDAIAAKLDNSGNLLWNTFLGGSDEDHGYAIAVDSSGNVYVSGDSLATWGASPVRAYTPAQVGADDNTSDAFVAKISAAAPRVYGVGGEVQSINRNNLLVPWLILGLIVIVGGSVLVVKRRRSP